MNTSASNTFRGNKRHLYSIQNPFAETHKFIICTTPEYQKSMNSATMKWFVPRKKKRWERLAFETINKGFKGKSFILKGGEIINILGEFGFKPGTKTSKVSLPVEILVDRLEGTKTRKPTAKSLNGKFAAVAGFTIILTNKPANMIVKVVDKKGNPILAANVHIQTINHLQKETVQVNKNGEVVLKSINPDVYRIKAEAKSGQSKGQIIELPGGKTKELRLMISSPDKKPVKEK